MQRRQFLIAAGLGGLTLVALSGKKALAQAVPVENIQVTISRNHGHAMVIEGKDASDGMNHSYDIQGSSSHPHTVELTQAQFASILAGETVEVQSSQDAGHSHMVTLSLKK